MTQMPLKRAINLAVITVHQPLPMGFSLKVNRGDSILFWFINSNNRKIGQNNSEFQKVSGLTY